MLFATLLGFTHRLKMAKNKISQTPKGGGGSGILQESSVSAGMLDKSPLLQPPWHHCSGKSAGVDGRGSSEEWEKGNRTD